MKWRKVSIQKIASFLLVLVLLFPSAVPALAAKVTPSRPDKMPPSFQLPKSQRWIQNVERKRAYEDAIRKMERHLYLGADGLLHLDVDSGEAIGVPNDVFQELSSGLAITNAHLRAGDLRVNDIALSNGTNLLGQRVPLRRVSPETMSAVRASCAGWTGITYTWFGPRYYLDNCMAQALAAALASAAGAVAFFSGLGFNIPADAIGGLLAFGGGYILAVDALGGFQGIYIQVFWSGSLGWIWHQ